MTNSSALHPIPNLAVTAIGNAIVDVIARADDTFLARTNMVKGSMQLIDADAAATLYAHMPAATEMSGGSAANTLAGMAMLGSKCGFIGQVCKDQLGTIFAHDIRACGVEFLTPASQGEPPTGQCLIFVTPDGQRTMNTFLGAAQNLGADALDADMIARSHILYLEGYLWNADASRDAMAQAIAIAKSAGRKVAFTLSDTFVVMGHGDSFRNMIARGEIDILFANEAEILTLAQTQDLEIALASIAPQVPLLVVTLGADGALAIQDGQRHTVAAEPIDHVVDTTGAGDLFAAGFLTGLTDGREISDCLTMGSICAREIIAQVGPRANTDLKALVSARFAAK
jgi:sugar/nucleoside kinase (ribokinase family)